MRFKAKWMLAVLVGVCAMGVITAPAFATSKPEFKPGKEKFTGKLGATRWVRSANLIACKSGTTSGEILTGATVGKFVLTFTGCEASGEGGNGCSVQSPGQPEGRIVTNSLEAELGTVAKSEAASGVGLLIGGSTTYWGVVAGAPFIEESGWHGTWAAEVKTVGKKQATNELVFSVAKAGLQQEIKTITLDSGKVESPKLTMFSQTLTIEGLDELTFPEATEVT